MNKNFDMKTSGILKFLTLALFVAGGLSLQAQSTAAYEAENEGWLVSLDEAYAQSKKTGKPIMANFTGSDWCGWCKRLTASVFSKPDFKQWAAENVVLLELDFPKRKKLPDAIRSQNAGLQRAFKITGYPTVWVFDLDKKDPNAQYNISALGKTGYSPSVEKFTTGVDQMIAKRVKTGS